MTDQLAGRAMNMALWPATLGYWLHTMLAPASPRTASSRPAGSSPLRARRRARAGAAHRLQPYGILPATALSRAQWMQQRDVPGGGPDRRSAAVPGTSPAAADGRRSRLAHGDPVERDRHVRRDDDADPHADAARHPRPAPRLGRVGAPQRREHRLAVQPPEPDRGRRRHPRHHGVRPARPRPRRRSSGSGSPARPRRRSSTRSSREPI